MLGYIIGPKGIRANPDKTKAIISMVEPSTKKEVQKLKKNSGAEQIHLKVSRTQPPILQSLKTKRKSGTGTRTVEGFPTIKKLLGHQACSDSTRSGGSTTVIHRSLRPRS